MNTTQTKPDIVKQIEGGYYLDRQGQYWLLNPQLGWISVKPEESRSLRFYLGISTK